MVQMLVIQADQVVKEKPMLCIIETCSILEKECPKHKKECPKLEKMCSKLEKVCLKHTFFSFGADLPHL